MSIGSAASFDAAQEVPDGYDVFCESCAYSLAGLTGDRCPECGEPFDPKGLPFARIPWLHRRRLGTVNAYLRTVALVCFRPSRFARELCRPVRISANDARSFRLTTIWLLTALLALIVGAIWTAEIVGEYRYRRADMAPLSTMLFYFFATLAGLGAFNLFLRLATDMPLFIWKGLPSMRPIELSPLHQYACAPLLLFPILMPIIGYLAYLRESYILNIRLHLGQLAVASTIISPLWLWLVALVLMQSSTRPGIRRLVLLGVYLPIHWFLMLAMSYMLWGVFIGVEHFVAGMLHIKFNWF